MGKLTVSEKLWLLTVGVVLAGAAFLFGSKQPPAAPVRQPSVPSYIAPKCDGRCGNALPPKPFRVSCPYCRNQLLATPPELGEIGEVATLPQASK